MATPSDAELMQLAVTETAYQYQPCPKITSVKIGLAQRYQFHSYRARAHTQLALLHRYT